MKRRDDNRQLRPEEVDALEEETEEPGEFARASADVIAARRIIKPKRFSLETADTPAKTPFNSFGSMTPAPSTNASNPFASFSGLTKQPSAPAAPKAEPIIKQTPATFTLGATSNNSTNSGNPFSGFSGLTKQTGAPKNELSKPDTLSSSAISSTPSSNSSTSTVPKISSSKSKIERLNQSFVKWLEKQSVDHPISIWSGGLQDYIKYAKQIAEESQNSTPDQTVSTTQAASTSSEAKKTETFSLPKTNLSNENAPKTETQKTFTGFSFPSTNTSTAASSSGAASTATGFSFGPKPSLPATTSLPTTNLGGFGSFQGFGSKTLNGTSQIGSGNLFGKSKGEDEGGEDAEGEGEEEVQQLEPIEILKNDNDTDEILYEVSTKLFRFDKNANEWKDIGKGILRVTRDQTVANAKKRILIRNNLGKISLNTNIWKGMTIKQSGKNGIQFFVPDESSTLHLYLIKVKPDDFDKTLSFLSQIEKSL